MHADELVSRQRRLLARSAHLREAFAMEGQHFKSPLALTDQLVSGLDWLRRHPGWPVGGLLLTAILRPRKAMAWAGRVWWAWSAVKHVQRWVASR